MSFLLRIVLLTLLLGPPGYCAPGDPHIQLTHLKVRPPDLVSPDGSIEYTYSVSWLTSPSQPRTIVCGDSNSCQVGLCYDGEAGPPGQKEACVISGPDENWVFVEHGATKMDVYNAWIKQMGHTTDRFTYVYDRSYDLVGHCMSLYVMHQDNRLTKFPMSDCGYIPPDPPSPTRTCSLPTALNIDFGNVERSKVNGYSKHDKFRIVCASVDGIRLALTTSQIDMGSSLYSKMSINGNDLALGIYLSMDAGENPIDVQTTLHTTGEKINGKRTGQGVVVLSYD